MPSRVGGNQTFSRRGHLNQVWTVVGECGLLPKAVDGSHADHITEPCRVHQGGVGIVAGRGYADNSVARRVVYSFQQSVGDLRQLETHVNYLCAMSYCVVDRLD